MHANWIDCWWRLHSTGYGHFWGTFCFDLIYHCICSSFASSFTTVSAQPLTSAAWISASVRNVLVSATTVECDSIDCDIIMYSVVGRWYWLVEAAATSGRYVKVEVSIKREMVDGVICCVQNESINYQEFRYLGISILENCCMFDRSNLEAL